jgi:polyisoprenoid-binding protein YceI
MLSGFTKTETNTEWTIVSSIVSFKIKNAGFNIYGSLSSLNAKIFFDPSKAFSNSIEATIYSKSINTDNTTRDGHLKKEEYFEADKFPKISLKANLFKKETNGDFNGFFKLTIKNTTKDIRIPFTFTEKDGKGLFKSSFTINRLDYGVGASSMILSDDATIHVEMNVLKKQ